MKRTSFSPGMKVSYSASLSTVSFAGEHVLLNHQSGIYYGVNSTGAFIWELIGKAGCTYSALLEAVLTKYGIPREQAENDVQNLLQELEKEGLIAFSK